MNAVDRANYVKDSDGVDAYYDSPLLRFRTSSYEIELCLTDYLYKQADWTWCYY